MKTRSEVDFAALLGRVEDPPEEEDAFREVTEAELLARADAMARRGYRHSEETLAALRDWMEGRGLILMGGVGSGKTSFFRALRHPMTQREGDRGGTIAVFPMMDVVGRTVQDVRETMERLAESEVVLDDVGAEPAFNDFGSRLELLPWLVEMRLRSKAKTDFTTNLTGEELRGRYGMRTVDRMHELAAAHRFTGKSMRATRRTP